MLSIANGSPSQASSVSLTSSSNPSVSGQSVTFMVSVSPSSGSSTPTGNVTFNDGATTLGNVALSGGQANLTTSSLPVRSHSITAAYSGDSNFSGSASPVLTQVVNQAPTSTAISSSPNPAVTGQSVTFTATVSPLPPGGGTPTGSVTFTDGATTLGTAGLNGSGQAMLTVPSLSPGSHSIAGQYSGDSNFGSSSSAGGGGGGFTQTVNRASTTTTVNSSVNASILNQPVTFTAHVSVVSPGSGSPTGSVAFQDGSTVLGTVALSAAGSATFTTSSLVVNAHSITAAYSGDSNFSGSTSATLIQRVQYEPAGTTCDGNAGHQILQPINSDGTSVFKLGRPVPAMFRVCDFLGNSVGTPGVVQNFFLTQIISGTVTQTVEDNVDSMTPDTAFRWDPTNQQWIFNIATKGLSTNKTYVYAITLNDGTMIGFQFGLK